MKRVCACAALAGVFIWAAPAAPVTEAVNRRESATVQWTAPAPALVLLAAADRENAPVGALGSVFQPVAGAGEHARRADLPEPATFALIGSALLALGVIRRRRQI
ncbi:MAG TPA: PEP-CTERM sorting domain-containing protein [Bryobacteraceae bacterium]|nr:PEP-CTERM sorting domain-containing protein [Bryobacteraceae bacterium]